MAQSEKYSDTPAMLIDGWRLLGVILRVIFILTLFNIEKLLANLCQHKHSMLAWQRSSDN